MLGLGGLAQSVDLDEPLRGRRVVLVAFLVGGQLVDGHTFGPAHLLGLAAALYGHVPESYLLLLPTENFDFGEGLSPTTARAAERALRFLDGRLTACYSQGGGGGA